MKTVYLDNAANTALDKRVIKAMKPFMNAHFVGNANAPHDYGIRAAQAIASAREVVGEKFGVDLAQVIFTSGATESNNAAIKSVCLSELCSGKTKKEQRRHIICSSIEHSSVLNTCKQMEKLGFKVDYIQPDRQGRVDGLDIVKHITNQTLLVCEMAVNNETGSLNTHLKELFEETSRRKIYSLFDCTQYVTIGLANADCKIFEDFKADFVSFSAHKLNGPTGSGALICSPYGLDCLKQQPLIMGGAQEFGIRGSTSNTAGIVGLAKAVEIASQAEPVEHYLSLKTHLIDCLGKNGVDFHIHGGSPKTSIVSLGLSSYYKNYDIASLSSILAVYGVAVSAGSACDSDHDETQGIFNPSHVLVAMGLTEKQIRCTIRVSFDKTSSKKDIDYLVKQIVKIHEDLKN